MMRTTITIPDPLYEKIKSSLDEKGFVTVNDYLLSLLREGDHQIDAPKKSSQHQIDDYLEKNKPQIPMSEEDSKWPSHYLGKPLSGRKQNCPNCKENVPIEFAQKHYMDKHSDI